MGRDPAGARVYHPHTHWAGELAQTAAATPALTLTRHWLQAP